MSEQVSFSEGWLIDIFAAAGALTLVTQNAARPTAHSSGVGERQGALASRAEHWAAGGGEGHQEDKVPADWEDDGGAKEEDDIEIKLCPLGILPQSQSWPQCTADISRDTEI